MSAGLIIGILSGLFVLLLVIGFFVGFARGVKRSALELGITFVGILIAGFITPVVTNAILGINVTVNGVSSSLQTYFVNVLAQDPTFGVLLESSPTMAAFLEKLPSVMLCAVVFLVLNILIRVLVYITYKIISVCCFKSKKEEKELGLKRNRWVGGLIGTFKMLMLALVITMPLTSLVKLVDNNLQAAQSSLSAATAVEEDSSGDIFSSLPPIVKDVVHGVNKSAFGVLNGCAGLDDFIFDNISQFELNGEKIKVRKEISSYIEIYKQASALSTSVQNIKDLDWNALDKLYVNASKSKLYTSIGLNIVGEMITNYPSLISLFPELGEFEQIFEDIKLGMAAKGDKVAYLKSDIDNLYRAMSALGRSGYLDEVIVDGEQIDVTSAITILANDYSDILVGTIDKLGDMNILRDALSPTLDFALSKVSGTEVGSIFKDANTQISDWNSLKSQLVTLISEFGAVNSLIEDQGVNLTEIISDAMKVLLVKQNVPSILSKFGGMLDTVDAMEIFTDSHGDKILPKIFAQLGVGDLRVVEGESISTYKGVFEFIAPAANNLISLDLYNTVSNGADFNAILKKIASRLASERVVGENGITYSTFFTDTILPIYKVTAIKEAAIDEIVKISQTSGLIDFSLLEVEGDFNASYANWETDLKYLTQAISALEAKQFDETQTMLDFILAGGDINAVLDKLSANERAEIVEPIMNAKSTKPLKEQIASTVIDQFVDGETAEALKNIIVQGLEDEETLQKVADVVKENEPKILEVLGKAEEYGVKIDLSQESAKLLNEKLDALEGVGQETINKLKDLFKLGDKN